MPEYALKFDHGWWIVMCKSSTGGAAFEVARYDAIDLALGRIQDITGAPVLLKVLTL